VFNGHIPDFPGYGDSGIVEDIVESSVLGSRVRVELLYFLESQNIHVRVTCPAVVVIDLGRCFLWRVARSHRQR
jgi:hypothetical protein